MYFPLSSTEEALATARFSAGARKGLCVLIGESGYGKSLLLQMLLDEFLTTHEVLVANGHRSGPDGLPVQMYVPARGENTELDADAGTKAAGQPAGATLLDAWRACPGVHPIPRVLLVDDAEALSRRAWDDVASIVCTDQRRELDLEAILIGSPRLLNLLADADFMRIRRRVFRVNRIVAMSQRTVMDYVHHRVRVAGGNPERVFPATLAPILHRFSRGNPSIVNLLCDNALLEAYSDGRHAVAAGDVGNAAFALTGGPPAPTRGEPRSVAEDVRALGPGADTTALAPSGELSPARLQRLEQRLAQALDSIRAARRRTSVVADIPASEGLLSDGSAARATYVPSAINAAD